MPVRGPFLVGQLTILGVAWLLSRLPRGLLECIADLEEPLWVLPFLYSSLALLRPATAVVEVAMARIPLETVPDRLRRPRIYFARWSGIRNRAVP
jgi:hypothetical protein